MYNDFLLRNEGKFCGCYYFGNLPERWFARGVLEFTKSRTTAKGIRVFQFRINNEIIEPDMIDVIYEVANTTG